MRIGLEDVVRLCSAGARPPSTSTSASYQAIARLKEELGINVELVAPSHFIPPLPGWETRSGFISQEGRVSYYHCDFYSQALATIERAHPATFDKAPGPRFRKQSEPSARA